MLNIVIPMAGAGSRFQTAGYHLPKPVILIRDIPMIQIVIKNLMPKTDHRFIFICQEDHLEKYSLSKILPRCAPNCKIVTVHGLTEGAACTVLAARSLINNDRPLIIANSDQWVDVDINDYIEKTRNKEYDGVIMTMRASDPKWSYVCRDTLGLVTRVVEKKVVSDEATVGIYSFTRGLDFVNCADAMISADLRVNGEFYVAPVYNHLISTGSRIGTFAIGEDRRGMHGLGTPADLEAFLESPVLARALEGLNHSKPVSA